MLRGRDHCAYIKGRGTGWCKGGFERIEQCIMQMQLLMSTRTELHSLGQQQTLTGSQPAHGQKRCGHNNKLMPAMMNSTVLVDGLLMSV